MIGPSLSDSRSSSLPYASAAAAAASPTTLSPYRRAAFALFPFSDKMTLKLCKIWEDNQEASIATAKTLVNKKLDFVNWCVRSPGGHLKIWPDLALFVHPHSMTSVFLRLDVPGYVFLDCVSDDVLPIFQSLLTENRIGLPNYIRTISVRGATQLVFESPSTMSLWKATPNRFHNSHDDSTEYFYVSSARRFLSFAQGLRTLHSANLSFQELNTSNLISNGVEGNLGNFSGLQISAKPASDNSLDISRLASLLFFDLVPEIKQDLPIKQTLSEHIRFASAFNRPLFELVAQMVEPKKKIQPSLDQIVQILETYIFQAKMRKVQFDGIESSNAQELFKQWKANKMILLAQTNWIDGSFNTKLCNFDVTVWRCGRDDGYATVKMSLLGSGRTKNVYQGFLLTDKIQSVALGEIILPEVKAYSIMDISREYGLNLVLQNLRGIPKLKKIQTFFSEKTKDIGYLLIMEKCDNNLKDLFERNLLTYLEKLKIFKSLLYIFKDVHAKNIVFSDLNLANILINMNELTVFLADFGSSYKVGSRLGSSATPLYSSPEFFSFKAKSIEHSSQVTSVGISHDTFGLGILLYEIVYGTAPALKELDSMRRQLLSYKSETDLVKKEEKRCYFEVKLEVWKRALTKEFSDVYKDSLIELHKTRRHPLRGLISKLLKVDPADRPLDAAIIEEFESLVTY